MITVCFCVCSNHVFILGNFTRHSRLHQPLHRHYQKEGRCKYIITTFWASYSYSFFLFAHVSFLLSQWMLLCSLWLTLPPSLSSLWIQFSSVCLTLESQQSSSRQLSTPSSSRVSVNLHPCASNLWSSNVFIGVFYLIVDAGTLIDWWIITRETVFIFIYLAIITYFLMGN